MKANIPFEKLNFKRTWFSYNDLSRMGFLSAKIITISSDRFTLAVDKANSHYGVDFGDMQLVSYSKLYIDKSESTWKYNLKNILIYSNGEFEKAIETFNEMNKTFKKNKQLRKENKLNIQKFKTTFPGMELPKNFYQDHCQRRYDIIYTRKARKLIKKFKKAIRENKATLNALINGKLIIKKEVF